MRARQQKGFEQAMADMTVNLDKELDSVQGTHPHRGPERARHAG